MLNIFVCHYTKLINRMEHISKEIDKLNNVNVYFISEYDKEDITNEVNEKFFIFNNYQKIWNERINYYIKKKENGRLIRDSEKSLALKHYTVLKKILELKIDYALVIEDDIKFVDDFINKLQIIIQNLPPDWDLYIPCSKKIINHKKYKNSVDIGNKYIVKQPHPATVGTYSYLINSKCCKDITKEIENNKIRLPIDFEYNWIFYKLNLNVYFNNNNKPLIKHVGLKSSIR